jgi:hypothetical protein
MAINATELITKEEQQSGIGCTQTLQKTQAAFFMLPLETCRNHDFFGQLVLLDVFLNYVSGR